MGWWELGRGQLMGDTPADYGWEMFCQILAELDKLKGVRVAGAPSKE